MKLQIPKTQPPAGVWPSDIGSLAFASDEFFDVLDMFYLQRNGIRSSFPSPDRGRDGQRQNLKTPRLGQYRDGQSY